MRSAWNVGVEAAEEPRGIQNSVRAIGAERGRSGDPTIFVRIPAMADLLSFSKSGRLRWAAWENLSIFVIVCTDVFLAISTLPPLCECLLWLRYTGSRTGGTPTLRTVIGEMWVCGVDRNKKSGLRRRKGLRRRPPP